MKIILHGAAQEVGRSCVEVNESNTRFLFDAGLKIMPKESVYPSIPKEISKIKAIFLSHCHLDHSGALPFFYNKGFKGKVFSNLLTKSIARILLKDSWKVGKIKQVVPEYNKKDINKILDRFEIIRNYQPETYDKMNIKYQDAGHIPGASSVEVEVNKKTVLYSGDINTTERKLVKGANIQTRDPDAFIVESTYGDRDHPDKEEQEKEFLKLIKETLEDNGRVIIPTFAVGRAQEIILMLSKKNFGVPIYLDGMAKKITEQYLDHPEFIRDPDALKKALEKVHFVEGRKDRAKIINDKAIFLTTSGMMDGGPVIDYLSHMWAEKKNSILLTGYQADDSNGRSLLEKGKVRLDDKTVKVKCFYRQFDFSAHIGMSEMHQLIKKVNPKSLILNHGDPPSIENMKQWATQEGFEVYAPERGKVIDLGKGG